jgi:glycosyltransferase involved in cell wall biosynthesis
MPNFVVFTTLLPRLLGAKIILDLHDPMPEIYQSHFNVSEDHWIIRLMRLEENLSCRYANCLLTVNEPMRELLIERGVNPALIKVVMNFPDPKIFSPDLFNSVKTDEREARFRLVYTGLVSQRNGLDIAVEAVRILRDEMPDLSLMIVGNGPSLPDLKALVNKYDLYDNVIFEKPVMIDKVPGILLNCDLGISPHRDNAFTRLMFSTKVAEYLSLGLPVITARTYTMEHYFDESTLFFFEPGSSQDLADQIKLIRKRPELVEAKRMQARERMRELNWQEERIKYLRFIESCTGAEAVQPHGADIKTKER